jgi:hypothetical protein
VVRPGERGAGSLRHVGAEDAGGTASPVLGVSGHRAYAAEEAVAHLVDDLLDHVGPEGTVLTSLAEGADRLVADRALARPGWGIEVVLPLEADDYAQDFGSDDSRRDFERLLAAASAVEVVGPQPTREDAYLAAGIRVLDGSTALLAVWDGGPARGTGGTAELVAEARRRRRPVAWVRVQRLDVASSAFVPRCEVERWPWAR